MGEAAGIAKLLASYGGWGLSAVLMAVVGILARHIVKQNESRLQDQKECNEIMLELVEKRVETDLKHSAAFKGLKGVVEKLIEKL
jgi:hypothetical protein